MNTLSPKRLTEIEDLNQALGMEVIEQRELVRGYRQYVAWVNAAPTVTPFPHMDDVNDIVAAAINRDEIDGDNGRDEVMQEFDPLQPLSWDDHGLAEMTPTIDDETPAGMSELNDGVDFSDGHDCEGYKGGCERMGHTTRACPVAQQILSSMYREDTAAEVYAKRAHDVEQHQAQGEAVRPINGRADVAAHCASIASQDQAIADSLRLAAERAVTDDMIEACKNTKLPWERGYVGDNTDVRTMLVTAMMCHIKATTTPHKWICAVCGSTRGCSTNLSAKYVACFNCNAVHDLPTEPNEAKRIAYDLQHSGHGQ